VVRVHQRQRPALERDVEASAELTIDCTVRARTTVVTVRGTVDEVTCRQLADGLELARTIRGAGPILVDLSGVGQLGFPGMRCLVHALRDAEHAGRPFTVRL
jgi:anti-anti-sigma regulatory factor